MEDFIKPFFTIKVEYETLLLKILAMMFGLSCIILTFIVEYLGPGVLQASLTIFGVVGGPVSSYNFMLFSKKLVKSLLLFYSY